MTRDIIVVGDPSVAMLLDFAPIDWTTHNTATCNTLWAGRDSGTLPARPDAVIFTDQTGDTITDLMNTIGTLLMNRIPVGVLTYYDSTATKITELYPALEQHIATLVTQRADARAAAGETVTDADRRSPLDTTELIVSKSDHGIGGLIAKLGPALRHPLTEADIATLPSKFYTPLPRAHTATTDATPRTGKVVSVVSSKGGCGKSTVSMMLAASVTHHTAAAGDPKTVVVVDMDRQPQLHYHYPRADKGMTGQLASGSPDDVLDHLYEVPNADNMYVLFGARSSKDQLALRTVGLYEHVIGLLSRMFDLVILDCAGGILGDDVTGWALTHSDLTLYVLDQSGESMGHAIESHTDATKSIDDGGLGLSEESFQIVQNRIRGDKELRAAFQSSIARMLPNTPIFAVLPDSHPEVSDAKDEGRLVELVTTSPTLADPLFTMAKRLFPFVTAPDTEPGEAGGLKKWLNR